MAVILTPLAEIFDRWDTAGLDNDTEFAVFAFVFALCLVLLICRLISSLARFGHRVRLPEGISPGKALANVLRVFGDSIMPHASPPLRI